MNEALARLNLHAFNLVGLSDREKFHTGMMAFALKWLLENEPELGCRLVENLWGAERGVDRNSLHEIEIHTESSGLDLVLKNGPRLTHWAEVKLKTGLRKNQIQDYEEKSAEASGVLLGLLPEPTGSDRTHFRSFPDVICALLNESAVNFLKTKHSENDSVLLIGMWTKYLGDLGSLSRKFQQLKLDEVPEPAKTLESLKAIKLAGIFERYRYGLVLESIGTIDASVACMLFNSNGNAGLDFRIDGPRPYGLQWQAGALKLFIEEPNFQNEQLTQERDAMLNNLAERYAEKFGPCAREKVNRNGKFRSMSVSHWKIFDHCGDRVRELRDRMKFLCTLRPQLFS